MGFELLGSKYYWIKKVDGQDQNLDAYISRDNYRFICKQNQNLHNTNPTNQLSFRTRFQWSEST